MSLDCSVIVLTYFPDTEKLLFTLKSILMQRDNRFEIIIADDGSTSFPEEEVHSLMKKFSFADYRLLLHKENQGTVLNLLDAVSIASGKYVKPISPGDYFYSDDSLQKICSFSDQLGAKVVFGSMVYYHYDNELVIHKKKTPLFDARFDPYNKTFQRRKNLKYQLIYSDLISGASSFFERETYFSGLKEISGKVRYAEDVLFQWFSCNGERTFHFDSNFVWYEYGTGISTNGQSGAINRIMMDFIHFYPILKERFPNVPYVKRAAFLWKHFKPWKPTLLFRLINLDRTVYGIFHRFALKKVCIKNIDSNFFYRIIR